MWNLTKSPEFLWSERRSSAIRSHSTYLWSILMIPSEWGTSRSARSTQFPTSHPNNMLSSDRTTATPTKTGIERGFQASYWSSPSQYLGTSFLCPSMETCFMTSFSLHTIRNTGHCINVGVAKRYTFTSNGFCSHDESWLICCYNRSSYQFGTMERSQILARRLSWKTRVGSRGVACGRAW